MVSTPTITLKPTGQQMPIVGFGLWKVNNDTCADTVYNAIKTGYRLLDGACDYGNEKEAGEGLKRAIDDGLVKREEVFVSSKLWNTFHAKKHVKPAVKKQLADWGLQYFDLFLIHFPIALEYVDPSVRYPPGWAYDGENDIRYARVPLQQTWEALEELVDEGLAKNIGISNYQGSLVLDLLRYARIRPAVLQIEHHPYLVQKDLVDLAKAEDIAVTAYSSFGPQSFIELKWQKAYDTPTLFKHNTITSIAEKHNKTPAQVLLRWTTQRGLAVIPKSNSQHRLHENLNVTSFDLTEEEIKAISGLDRGLRFNNPVDYLGKLSIFA
ncbi:NADP-dependent oxidoreductase domain-containing protein [Kalaharituber pfeilii]|nr:NADP-dependent oxidoreductase domain-containing protein [Kalaharituber pfeilii]